MIRLTLRSQKKKRNMILLSYPCFSWLCHFLSKISAKKYHDLCVIWNKRGSTNPVFPLFMASKQFLKVCEKRRSLICGAYPCVYPLLFITFCTKDAFLPKKCFMTWRFRVQTFLSQCVLSQSKLLYSKLFIQARYRWWVLKDLKIWGSIPSVSVGFGL